MKKAYLDANILIDYVVGPEEGNNQYAKALSVFSEIKEGKILGVVSTLTQMEILGVFRMIKGSELEEIKSKPEKSRLEYVLKESKGMFEKMMSEIIRMPNIKLEKGKTTNLQTVLNEALTIMNDIKGDIRFFNHCKKCGSENQSSGHRAVATVDILHAILARDIGCESLITFDKGFNELKNMENFTNLEIDVR